MNTDHETRKKKIPKVQIIPFVMDLREGGRVELQCQSETYQTEWYKLNGQFSINTQIAGNRLVINAYENEVNKGVYVCAAYLGDEANNATILLNNESRSGASIETKIVQIIITKVPIEDDTEKNVELVCNTGFSHSDYRVTWLLPQASKINNTFLSLQNTVLKIKNFTENNLGIYTCQLYSILTDKLISINHINLTMNSLVKSGINRHAFYEPEPPSVDLVVYNNETLIFDAMIRVDCLPKTVSGTYSLEWTRNGQKMPLRSYVNKNSLIINRFEASYLGKYSCIVRNNYGRTIRTIQFYEENTGVLNFKIDKELQQKPLNSKKIINKRFKVLIGSDKIHLGDTIAVECLNLEPSSRYTPKWRRMGELLKNYDLPHILIIRNVSINDVGDYFCEIEPGEVGLRVQLNKDGSFELKELKDEVPKIRIVLSNKLDIARGIRFEVTCLSMNQNFKQAWYRVIDESLLRLVTRDLSFVRSPIKDEDMGRYRCVVGNQVFQDVVVAKQDAKTGVIYAYVEKMRQVEEPIGITMEKRKEVEFKTADVGYDVMLNCPGFNDKDSQKVKWFKDTSLLITEKGMIIIKNVQNKDFGEYTCVLGSGLESRVWLVRSEEVPLFEGSSFVAFNASQILKNFEKTGMSIEVTFKSFKDDGLVLRLVDEKVSGTIMDLELVGSMIHYRFRLGLEEIQITVPIKINKATWCTVSLTIHNQTISLRVGNNVYNAFWVNNMALANMQDPILYLGGYKRPMKTTGLNGLLTYLIVNNRKVNLLTDMFLRHNISAFDFCATNASSNCGYNERCINTQNKRGYRCECFGQIDKKNGCKQPAFKCNECRSRFDSCNKLMPYRNGGLCRQEIKKNFIYKGHSYVCDCLVNFNCTDCEQVLKLKYSVEFRGSGFIEIPGKLLNNKEFLISFRTRHANGILIIKHEISCRFEVYIDQGYLIILYVSFAEELRLVSSIKVNDGQMHTIAVLVTDKLIHSLLDNSQEQVAHTKVNKIRFNDEWSFFLGGSPGYLPFGPKLMSPELKKENFTGLVYSLVSIDIEEKYSVLNFGSEFTSGVNAFEPSGLFGFSY